MAGYAGLGALAGQPVYLPLKLALDRIGQLEAQVATLQTQVAALQAAGTGMTQAQVQQLVAAQLEAFKAGGLTAAIDTTTTPTITVARGLVTGAS